jgi:hypothetical protein
MAPVRTAVGLRRPLELKALLMGDRDTAPSVISGGQNRELRIGRSGSWDLLLALEPVSDLVHFWEVLHHIYPKSFLLKLKRMFPAFCGNYRLSNQIKVDLKNIHTSDSAGTVGEMGFAGDTGLHGPRNHESLDRISLLLT